MFICLLLCRRKPQNLTPPLSSDGGSSTSGQSPTSTHNGSPPPAVKRPPMCNDKYVSDGPTSKKQRISHFRKDVVNHDNTRSKYNSSCPIISDDNMEMLNYRRNHLVESRDLNARSRESDDISMRSSSYYG